MIIAFLILVAALLLNATRGIDRLHIRIWQVMVVHKLAGMCKYCGKRPCNFDVDHYFLHLRHREITDIWLKVCRLSVLIAM